MKTTDTEIKLTPIKPNVTQLEIGEKTILFSYKTAVAYHQVGVGYFRTKKYWSVTTSRHINQWLKENGATMNKVTEIE